MPGLGMIQLIMMESRLILLSSNSESNVYHLETARKSAGYVTLLLELVSYGLTLQLQSHMGDLWQVFSARSVFGRSGSGCLGQRAHSPVAHVVSNPAVLHWPVHTCMLLAWLQNFPLTWSLCPLKIVLHLQRDGTTSVILAPSAQKWLTHFLNMLNSTYKAVCLVLGGYKDE